MTVRARRPVGALLGGVAMGLAALLLTGCRIDVATDVAFDAEGGGEVAVSIRIDGATLRDLDRLGIDPGLDVALQLGTDSGWRSERTVDADGGLVLVYRQGFADGASATALLRELSADIAAQDPAVRLDVTVVTGPDGSVRLSGVGSIAPPATLGVSLDDAPVGPSGAELAALTAAAVRGQLTVRVPGPVIEHDADVIDGSIVRWDLPVGEPRPLTLVAGRAPLLQRAPGSLLLGGVVLVSAGAVVGRRRLMGRPAAAPAGSGAGDGRAGGVSPVG